MNKTYSIFLVAVLFLFGISFAVAIPNGASSVTEESSSTLSATSPENHSAIAGNLTELTIYGDSVTQSWQGYYGNVSGAIRLADSSGDPMYNWSLASPQGEIFASIADSITWTAIQCFNWATNGTTLESNYNIATTAADGVNETFSTTVGHEAFVVGTTSFAEDDCMGTRIFDSTGTGVDQNFEEVLLHDGANTVFAALLEEDTTGFDDNPHDFEMIVLEDGHSGDTDTTPYFFYVELE